MRQRQLKYARHWASIVVVCGALVLHEPLTAQATGPVAAGALVGGGVGVAAGLLFAQDSCDMDPCTSGTHVLAGAVGAALLGGSGALIGSRVRLAGSRGRRAINGALLGGVLGGVAGIVLTATSCDADECGAAGYASLAMAGAGVFGALGSLIGGSGGASSMDLDVGSAVVQPIVAPGSRGVMVGARIRS